MNSEACSSRERFQTVPYRVLITIKMNLVDSRVLRNKRLRTPSGPEGSSGSNPLCVPQGRLAINKLLIKDLG